MIRCRNCGHAEKFHINVIDYKPQPCDYEGVFAIFEDDTPRLCGCEHFVPMRGLDATLERIERDAAQIVEAHAPETPYPWCHGNPTKQDCIEAGYCRRDPNCGE